MLKPIAYVTISLVFAFRLSAQPENWQVVHDKTELSICDLGILMIVLSDNTATNMLIDLVGMENVNKTLAAFGLTQTRLQRKMMNTVASGRGEENLSTPAEAMRIMEILYRGEFLNR